MNLQRKATQATPADQAKPAPQPRRRRWKRWLAMGGAAAAASALLVFWLRPSTIPVQTATVTRGALQVSVEAQGRTRAKQRYTVGAPISGRLMRTPWREGDRISQGDVLARIAPPPTDARTAATARADLASAQARQRQAAASRAEAASHLKLANSEQTRQSALHAQGFISAQARETSVQAALAAASRLDVAHASLAAAVAGVESARSQLLGAGTGAAAGVIEIRAPVSGLVLKVYEESERVVAAGSPLFDLSQSEALELVIDLLTQDAVQVQAGNPIQITGWGGPAVLAGRVRHVEPAAFTKVSTLGVEEQRVNVIADLAQTPATLGAGYRMEAAIVTWAADQVLRVPSAALFRRDGTWHVFVLADGRARLRALALGRRNADFAELRSGLQEGEQVLLFPSALVSDGVRVSASAGLGEGQAAAAR